MPSIIQGTLVSVVNSAESPQTPEDDIKEEYMWTAQLQHNKETIELQENGWIWCKGENNLPKCMVYLKKKRA